MMKRLFCVILLCLLTFSFTACHQDQQKVQVPVNFYYPRQEAAFGSADSLIAPQVSEGMGYSEDSLGLLSIYLQGPTDPHFRSPFPTGVKILSMDQVNGLVRVTMSAEFATLTGMDLTLACACLTMTVLDLTDGNSVRISVPGNTLNGAEFIRMDRNCLNLLDTVQPNSQK